MGMRKTLRRPHAGSANRWLLGTLLLAALAACKAKDRPLLFHSGAGQRSSLDEIAAVFAARNPGTRIDFSYKGSGYFIADIAASKMGDLYMPGEEYYLLQAVERGFITDYSPSTDIAAHFITVIITPRGNPRGVRTIQDFARPGLRVGLADPEAAAIGFWQEKTFKRAGIWDQVKKNATMFAKCIPELGNATQLGAVDATIVWATTAVLYLKDIEIVPIEPKYRGLIRLPVAVLAFSKQPALARRLKAFILSEEGREIFHSHAYGIDVGPLDAEGFSADDGKATALDMKWLVEAARVAKDPSIPVSPATVGHLIKEVTRQRKTKL
ncbi:MAG: molybdate ABC transporter substrate-binding protein [Deltaproteobacteria bacterium]|nr:molybdate ABC transporter substrate-binding protein [Deltaproteobacteria bacterium]